MPVKMTRRTKNLEKFIDRLKELNKATVESGYFAEQGNHPTANMSYASLMNLHENGFTSSSGIDVPERPVRLLTIKYLESNKKNIINKPISRFLKGNSYLHETLDVIGKSITEYAQSVFGSSGLTPNSEIYLSISGKQVNNPLIFDGYLQQNWSYKTSESNSISNLF